MRKVKSSVLRTEQMREQFHRFDSAHPEVWDLFFQFTWEKIDLGYQHYGAKAVMERVRWESDAGGGEFKINNNHTRFFADRMNRILGREFFRRRKAKA